MGRLNRWILGRRPVVDQVDEIPVLDVTSDLDAALAEEERRQAPPAAEVGPLALDAEGDVVDLREWGSGRVVRRIVGGSRVGS